MKGVCRSGGKAWCGIILEGMLGLCVGEVVLRCGIVFGSVFCRELCKIVTYNTVLFLYFIWN